MADLFIPSVIAAPDSAAYWFVFLHNKLLVATGAGGAQVPFGKQLDHLGIVAMGSQYLGFLRGFPCYAVQAAEKTPAPRGMTFVGLRSLYGLLDDDAFKVALAAIHLVEWDATSRFCGRCGAPTEARPEERAKQCTACGALVYPRISPAVIVLIERGDRLLLARATRFTEVIYSVLAGFVEPGESLEETVSREVEEETGVRVKDVRYFGSQPWPFPDSLMIGFTACYASGEIHIDGKELVDAGWYSVDNLPPIPGKISIARKLIDSFIEKHRAGRRIPSE
jgi:NAD+ diphosphatase